MAHGMIEKQDSESADASYQARLGSGCMRSLIQLVAQTLMAGSISSDGGLTARPRMRGRSIASPKVGSERRCCTGPGGVQTERRGMVGKSTSDEKLIGANVGVIKFSLIAGVSGNCDAKAVAERIVAAADQARQVQGSHI